MKFGKRLCAFVLSAVMLLASVPAVSAANGTIIMNLGSNVMTVNGSTVAIDVDPAIKPQVQTVNGFGYTMLPLRAVVESMGGQVYYDIATKNITMTYNGTTVTHVIGTSTAYVNGTARELAIASYAANNRTYVHLRAIELLSSSIAVNWNANDRNRVEIVYPQNTVQPPIVIVPDDTQGENTDDTSVEIQPDSTEPINMTLHICNMLGEKFVLSSLMVGESEDGERVAQNMNNLGYGESKVLDVTCVPGYDDMVGIASGSLFQWNGVQLNGGTQYLNLYNNGVFYCSDDPGILGQTMAELGFEGSTNPVEPDRTVKVTLRNGEDGSVKGFQVYRAASTLNDPVFETKETISFGKDYTFELNYSTSASDFIIVATIELNSGFSENALRIPMTYRYGSMNLSGDTVTVTLKDRGKYSVSSAGEAEEAEEEFYIPFV